MDYYKVSPRVVPADKVSEIRITPMFRHAEFKNPARIKIYVHPFDGLDAAGKYTGFTWNQPDSLVAEWTMDGNAFLVKFHFAGEQEFNIRIFQYADDSDTVVKQENFHVYSLKDDLYALRPYIGNFHNHSTSSDGRQECRYTAARFRQIGLDFCAVSDHGNYKPSIEAQTYWKDINPDFKLYPGEEVHSKNNPVHIIHFGGKYSVNDLWRDHEEQYMKEVAEYQEKLTGIPEGVSKFSVAASEWVFDNIRKAGGLAVFCHPYWFIDQYVLEEGTTSAIFQRRKFDAFEILGGHTKTQPQSNNHQIVRYYEEQAKGNRFPVVGLDDSHNADSFLNQDEKVDSKPGVLFGWYSTMVFAKSDAVEDLITSIRAGNSAAVERIEGESLRVYSSFRLTKYTTFLMRHYMPMHNVLCHDEGSLMLEYLAGDDAARQALKALHGRVDAYRADAFRNTVQK